MVVIMRNPAFANSTDVSSPMPLDVPVITAICFDMALVYHTPAGHWNPAPRSGRIWLKRPSPVWPRACEKEGLMLAIRHRFPRNPYFQFHPLHTVFSLLGALLLFGMLVWFLAVPAR